MKPTEDSVAISDLGEVGICERRVYLRSKYGARTNAVREERIQRGNEVHKAAYEQNGPEAKTADKRCFVATAIYGGEAEETRHLRRFRDRHLMGSRAGRWAVGAYYKVSPKLVEISQRSRFAKRVLKGLVDLVVKLTSRST